LAWFLLSIIKRDNNYYGGFAMNEKFLKKEFIFISMTLIMLFCVPMCYSFDVRLNWDKSKTPNVTGYNIYRSLVSGSFDATKKIGTVNQNALEYLDTNLTKGTTYYYVVSTIGDGNIESDYSDEIAVAPFDYGDIDGKNEITPGDALLVLQIYDQSVTPTLQQQYAADMNHDGRITPQDALCVLKKYTKQADELCP
jgi:hypothetical protein